MAWTGRCWMKWSLHSHFISTLLLISTPYLVLLLLHPPNHPCNESDSLQTGSPCGFYSEICFWMARGRGREGEPAMALDLSSASYSAWLRDLSSYQIEINQSQQKRKWPCRSRRLSKKWKFWYTCACLHVSTVMNSYPKLRRKLFDKKVEENRSIYQSVACQ